MPRATTEQGLLRGDLVRWLINPRGWKRLNKLSRVNQAVVRDLLITQEFVTLRPEQQAKQAVRSGAFTAHPRAKHA